MLGWFMRLSAVAANSRSDIQTHTHNMLEAAHTNDIHHLQKAQKHKPGQFRQFLLCLGFDFQIIFFLLALSFVLAPTSPFLATASLPGPFILYTDSGTRRADFSLQSGYIPPPPNHFDPSFRSL